MSGKFHSSLKLGVGFFSFLGNVPICLSPASNVLYVTLSFWAFAKLDNFSSKDKT